MQKLLARIMNDVGADTIDELIRLVAVSFVGVAVVYVLYMLALTLFCGAVQVIDGCIIM